MEEKITRQLERRLLREHAFAEITKKHPHEPRRARRLMARRKGNRVYRSTHNLMGTAERAALRTYGEDS